MAKYRQLHITFWQDPFVEELESLEKFFYIYLMTNSKTTQCGCYEISMKLIKYETGLEESQILKFIQVLEDNKKIIFNKENMEFLILNWLKHNSFKSPKVLKCIQNENELVKTLVFKDYINSMLDINTAMDSLSIVYGKSIDTGPQQEQEQEQKQEEEKEEEKEDNNNNNNNNKLKKSNSKTDDYSDEYLNLYNSYPKHEGKRQGFINYSKRLKTHNSVLLSKSVLNYKKQIDESETENKYIIKISNFFGEKASFEDYLDDNFKLRLKSKKKNINKNKFHNFDDNKKSYTETELMKKLGLE
jgi:hypothetical protein